MNTLKLMALSVIIVVISMSAVFAQDGGLAETIENTAWELLVIRDFDALAAADTDSPAIIEFNDDGTFHMLTGCGELGGTYALDGESITFEVQMTSLVADCSDAQVTQTLDIEAFLPDVTRYSIDEETLTLAIDDDHDATFNRLHTIENTAWELLVIRDFDALAAADTDSPAIIEFNDDGTFHMLTGCGELGGTYALDGESIAFEIQMTSLVADCSDAQVAQTLDIEAFLPNVTRYSIDEETLTLAIDEDHDATFNQLHKIDDGGLVVPTDVVGVTWLWERFDDTAGMDNIVVDDPSLYTLLLNPDGTYDITADCNLASGQYTLEGSLISFEPGPTTLAECEPGSLYDTYLTRLGEAATFVMDGDKLILNQWADAGNMVFAPAQQ